MSAVGRAIRGQSTACSVARRSWLSWCGLLAVCVLLATAAPSQAAGAGNNDGNFTYWLDVNGNDIGDTLEVGVGFVLQATLCCQGFNPTTCLRESNPDVISFKINVSTNAAPYGAIDYSQQQQSGPAVTPVADEFDEIDYYNSALSVTLAQPGKLTITGLMTCPNSGPYPIEFSRGMEWVVPTTVPQPQLAILEQPTVDQSGDPAFVSTKLSATWEGVKDTEGAAWTIGSMQVRPMHAHSYSHSLLSHTAHAASIHTALSDSALCLLKLPFEPLV